MENAGNSEGIFIERVRDWKIQNEGWKFCPVNKHKHTPVKWKYLTCGKRFQVRVYLVFNLYYPGTFLDLQNLISRFKVGSVVAFKWTATLLPVEVLRYRTKESTKHQPAIPYLPNLRT